MDNQVPSYIKIIAGIVLTLLLVSAGFLLWNKSQDSFNTAGNQIDEMNNTMLEQKYTQYTGLDVSGSTVINAINKFWDSKDIYVSVTIGGTTTTYIYTDTTLSTLRTDTEMGTLVSAAKKASSSTYINPKKTFTGSIIRDSNTDGIIGISYTINP